MKPRLTWILIALTLMTPCVIFADQQDDGLNTEDINRLTVTQTWVGKNGKSIRGLFVKLDGNQIHILTEKGAKIEVAISNLSQPTQAWFHKAWGVKLERDSKAKDSIPADGVKLDASRIWHSTNGKHIRGKFLARDGDVIRLADSQGKIYKVPLTSLSDEDRIWFNKAWEAQQRRKTAVRGLIKPGQVQLFRELKLPAVAPIGYARVPEGKVTRLNIPQIDQSDYHDKDFNNFQSSMVAFMLWWHNYKVVKTLVTRDDNEKRIKWLYRTLNKYDFRQRKLTSGTQLQNFFQKEVKTSACFQIKDLRDGREVFSLYKTLDRFSPEFLSEYTQGANATILSLPVYKKGRKEWTAEVPLVECSTDGNMVFYMFGNVKLAGKLEKMPFDKKKAQKRGDKLPRYQIKITNMADTPDWFQDREYTFFLEGKDDAGLTVIVPNLVDKLDQEGDK